MICIWLYSLVVRTRSKQFAPDAMHRASVVKRENKNMTVLISFTVHKHSKMLIS